VSLPALLAAALLAGLAGGFAGGWKVQGYRWAAADGARAEAQVEQDRMQRRVADESAARHAAELAAIAAQRRTITREVERVVESPVYRNVCLDADGLRLVEAAATGRAADTGEPAPALPASAAAR